MWRSPTAFTDTSMRECRASRSSIWSKKPMPVATLDTPDPSRFTETSISVSLVLRLMVAVRMKTAFPWPKTRPFNRLMSPSLLRDDALEAELRPMVSGFRPPNRANCNLAHKSLNPCQREVLHASITIRVAGLARHYHFDGPQGRQSGDRRRRAGVDRPDRHQIQRQKGPQTRQGRRHRRVCRRHGGRLYVVRTAGKQA